MREVRYQLVFDGKVSPEDEMGSVMRLETRASFAPDTHAVFSTGAPMAVLTAAVEPDDFGGFRETGEIVFGGGSLSFTTEGEGRIGDSAIPTHQLGSVLLCIESGTGAFAGATGTVASVFTVSENAEMRDSQSAVIFLED
ncbi:MAG: hypothetical protein WA138_14205 [Parvibaculum sp.]